MLRASLIWDVQVVSRKCQVIARALLRNGYRELSRTGRGGGGIHGRCRRTSTTVATNKAFRGGDTIQICLLKVKFGPKKTSSSSECRYAAAWNGRSGGGGGRGDGRCNPNSQCAHKQSAPDGTVTARTRSEAKNFRISAENVKTDIQSKECILGRWRDEASGRRWFRGSTDLLEVCPT